MGKLAAQLLLRRLAGETVEPRIADLGFELVARASA
jgi:DNA-binding LacI/PurR family transcriptional regulator